MIQLMEETEWQGLKLNGKEVSISMILQVTALIVQNAMVNWNESPWRGKTYYHITKSLIRSATNHRHYHSEHGKAFVNSVPLETMARLPRKVERDQPAIRLPSNGKEFDHPLPASSCCCNRCWLRENESANARESWETLRGEDLHENTPEPVCFVIKWLYRSGQLPALPCLPSLLLFWRRGP